MTKKECKKLYIKSDIGLSEAVECLMFDFGLDRGQAFKYLGL